VSERRPMAPLPLFCSGGFGNPFGSSCQCTTRAHACGRSAPLHPARPTGPAHPFVSQRPPAKIDPQVPLAVRGASGCNGVRMGQLRMGTQALARSIPAFRRCEPTFGPAERTDGTRAFTGPDAGAFSPPRPHFVRPRVPRAFSRFFEISSCRFEISIRRPEAHFARREAEG
jgi:hypothetical protein